MPPDILAMLRRAPRGALGGHGRIPVLAAHVNCPFKPSSLAPLAPTGFAEAVGFTGRGSRCANSTMPRLFGY